MIIEKQTKVLRILFSVSELSGPYNQFSLPFSNSQSIFLELLSAPKIDIPETIKIDHADNNWFRFISNIVKASLIHYRFIHIHHANIAILAPLIRLITFGRHRTIIFTLGTCFNNLKLRHKIFLTLSIPFFTHFVCCSRAVRESLPSWFSTIGGDRVETIQHGINLDRIPPESHKKKQLVIATRLIKEKNVDLVISSLVNLHPDYKLLIAGDGKEKASLIRLKDQLGLEKKVEFLGIIPRDSALALMSESEFYISASNSDGMPIAVLEAAAAGCIPILVDSTPHKEIGNIGIKTYLFESNPESIAKALKDAISMSQEERRKVLYNNLQIIKNKCGTDTMMAKYLELTENKV